MEKFSSLAEMLSANSSLGEKKALAFEENSCLSFCSYKELNEKCLEEKRRFQSLRISSVAFIKSKSPSLVFSFFGACLAGLETCLIDPSETQERIDLMLKAFRPQRIEADEDFSPEETKHFGIYLSPRLNRTTLKKETWFFSLPEPLRHLKAWCSIPKACWPRLGQVNPAFPALKKIRFCLFCPYLTSSALSAPCFGRSATRLVQLWGEGSGTS
jgi:hypothetical protein